MKIYPLLIIFLFLVLLGCASIIDGSLSNEEKNFTQICIDNTQIKNIQTESKVVQISKIDQCYFELAKKFDKSDYCGLIKSVFERDDCYYHFALAKKDDELCKAIKGQLQQKCFIHLRLDTLTQKEAEGDYDYLI